MSTRKSTHRYSRDGDPSLFGLVNAITSVARDEENQDLKWRLEQLGGGLLSLVDSSDPTDWTFGRVRREEAMIA